MESYLILSDLQIPFEHQKAFEFCKYLKRHYKVENQNVICIGDEVDQYWGGMYKKNPDMGHTPTRELQAAREQLKPWYDLFPELKLCDSNHGSRWLRKALDAEIPSELIRKNREIMACPDSWRWQKKWIIEGSKRRFLAEHGDDWGGQRCHIEAALFNGMSTVMGHHHSKADIAFINTGMQHMWACVSGCLIDFEQYAFEYARRFKFKPVIGTTVITHGGAIPFFHPMN